MRIGQKQELFAKLLPRLLDKAHELGFESRIGDLFRDPRVHGDYGEKVGYSAAYSMHKLKIAVDINLFFDGVYMIDHKDFVSLGTWWKKQHELCRWGGDFKADDSNHFSLTHDGRT